VKLQDAKQSDWMLPVCGEINSSNRIGFSVLFTLPKTMESSPFNTDDAKSYFVYPRGKGETSAEFIISESSGEITDAGVSPGSERFEERWIKDSSGDVVGMDARGRMEHGGYWRRAIFSGHEAAGYSLQPGRRPNALDQMIDSACMAKR
jgi:hypothetical protein